jgi:leader peptidase (prepilin peptidase)/N-methyltransferase
MDIIVLQISTGAFLFILGLCVGSFLNVVVYRYQTGAKIANDRSRCMSCGKTLTPLMLVPLLSFLFQKGRCAYCRTKLSLQYPVTEALMGVITLAVSFRSGLFSSEPSLPTLLLFLSALTFFAVLLAVTVYDWKHKIIPDRFSVILSVTGLLYAVLGTCYGDRHFLPSLITGLSIAFPFAFLWFVSRGRWMGLGDAKLALGLGFFLGYPVGASIPVLAFWLGTIPAFALLLFRRGITMKSEIPFGPFLALSTFILYVTPIDILQLHSIWPNILG